MLMAIVCSDAFIFQKGINKSIDFLFKLILFQIANLQYIFNLQTLQSFFST